MDIMTVMKERAVDIISRMSEDKVYYVLQLLESIEGLSENMANGAFRGFGEPF